MLNLWPIPVIFLFLALALGGCAGGGSSGDALKAGTITLQGDRSTVNYTVNVTITGAPAGAGGTATVPVSVPITVPISAIPGLP
jgi:hypothetical protein